MSNEGGGEVDVATTSCALDVCVCAPLLQSSWESLKETLRAADAARKQGRVCNQKMNIASIKDFEERNKTSRFSEEFSDCTLLFTDIVTFTNICAMCTPYDVVTLLNDLYLRFDRLVGLHDAYKVETIGDAYMIVGGVPEHCENHAERVLNISIGMLMESKLVLSPITHKPIKIRLGVHCGPVVAGVVGIKMPRYCLFGDTVNVANKMESNGIQCKIHVSQSAKQNGLKANPSYVFVDRGNTEIRGKGLMYTYFLERNDRKSVWELCSRPRSGEQTIDGYMELHDQSIYQEEEGDNKEGLTVANGNEANKRSSDRKLMNGTSVDPRSHHVRSPTCTIF